MLQFPAACCQAAVRLREAAFEAYILADEAPEHLLHAANGFVEIEDARLEHLAPAEDKELPRQRGGAFSGAFDLAHLFLKGIVLVQLAE